MLVESITHEISKYIADTKLLVEFHNLNSRNSLTMWNVLSIANVVLTAGSTLASSLMAAYGSSNTDLAVCNGIFSFAILIFLRVQFSFQFNLLCAQHLQLANDFNELCSRFQLLELEPDPHVYKELVGRFVSIKEKNNLMRVRSCGFTRCC